MRVNGQPAVRWNPKGAPPPVQGAEVVILDGRGDALSATTVDLNGKGDLELRAVGDGTYLMVVEPPLQQRSLHEANASTTCRAQAAYRALKLRVTILKNTVVRAVLDDRNDIRGSALLNGKILDIDLKPDFWLCRSSSRQGKLPDAIIIHHTAEETPGSPLNTWTTGVGPHFVIDVDGFTVMTTECSQAAGHAGVSYWNGVMGHDLNRTSIGIEIVNKTGPYTPAQYDRLLVLLDDLCTTLNIPKHHVIGHQDIATGKGDPRLHDNRRAADPGPRFDWGKLTAEGFGMQLTRPAPAHALMYDGAFASPAINQKPKPPQKLSSTHGTPKAIKELQADLAAIGHFVNQSGVYDKYTEAAVLYFELHFDGRSIGFGKYVGPDTALKIKRCTVW